MSSVISRKRGPRLGLRWQSVAATPPSPDKAWFAFARRVLSEKSDFRLQERSSLIHHLRPPTEAMSPLHFATAVQGASRSEIKSPYFSDGLSQCFVRPLWRANSALSRCHSRKPDPRDPRDPRSLHVPLAAAPRLEKSAVIRAIRGSFPPNVPPLSPPNSLRRSAAQTRSPKTQTAPPVSQTPPSAPSTTSPPAAQTPLPSANPPVLCSPPPAARRSLCESQSPNSPP
jgi:hypothetical protein